MLKILNIIKRDAISGGIILATTAVFLVCLFFAPPEISEDMSSILVSVVSIPLASAYIFKEKKYDLKTSIILKPQKLKISAIIYIVICISIMMGTSFLIGVLSKVANNFNNESTYENIHKIVLVVLSCIIAPISEEIFFRLGLSSLSSASPDIFEDILAACIFTFFHFSLIHAPYYFILSLLCIYGARKFQNLWVSIIIHSVLNLIMVCLLI